MSTLTLTPNPAAPSSKVTVAATGVANRSTRIRLNGSVVVGSFLPGADGAFTRTITAPSPGSYTIEVQQKLRGWTPVKTAQLAVQAVPVPNPEPVPTPTPTPTPPPTPPSTGTVVPVSGFNTAIDNATTGAVLLLSPQPAIYAPSSPARLTKAATITAQAPTPLISPTGRPDGIFVFAPGGVTVSNLALRGRAGTVPTDGNGSALIEINGRPATENGYGVVRDVFLTNNDFDMPADADRSQHCVYLAGTIERLTIDGHRTTAHGGHPGASATGLHAYHKGATPCDQIVVRNSVFTAHDIAVLFWLPCKSLTFDHCDFVGSVSSDLRLLTGGDVYVTNCRGSKRPYLEPLATQQAEGIGPTILHETNNNWAWAG